MSHGYHMPSDNEATYSHLHSAFKTCFHCSWASPVVIKRFSFVTIAMPSAGKNANVYACILHTKKQSLDPAVTWRDVTKQWLFKLLIGMLSWSREWRIETRVFTLFRAEWPGIRFLNKNFTPHVTMQRPINDDLTCNWWAAFLYIVLYRVDSYPMGTRGSFPGGKAAGECSWPLTSI
jgi:hypothetical protein